MISAARSLLHTGVTSVQGPLVFVRNVRGAGLYDRVDVITPEDAIRSGRVVAISEDRIIVEVFQGTDGLSLQGTRLRLFDEPGNAERGEATYARLRCSGCHTLGGQGGPGGGPLDGFGQYLSPSPLAQAMWNAGPRMRMEQLRRGGAIPQIGGHDMAELQAYIRAEGLRVGREVQLQPLPDPIRGARVYQDKRCGVCHDSSRGQAPDITRAALSKTVSEIYGLLWNHSYAMGAEMATRGVPFPRFEGAELADLISHLYFLGYVGEEGDTEAGATVFTAKGCADCHGQDVEGAPDLAVALDRTDRAGLAAAMWNHAPQMHGMMAQESPFWPKFEPGEMRNLAAYLRELTRSARENEPGQ